MVTTFQGSVPTPTCALSSEVELTVYLKGEFLGLAVVAVLLQIADGEFFQRESSLHTKKQKARSRFFGQSHSHTKSSLCNISLALFEPTVQLLLLTKKLITLTLRSALLVDDVFMSVFMFAIICILTNTVQVLSCLFLT